MGIKSTAVLFGAYVRPILVGFATAFILALSVTGAVLQLGPAYFVLACGGATVHLGWQLLAWNDKDVRDSMLKFEVRCDRPLSLDGTWYYLRASHANMVVLIHAVKRLPCGAHLVGHVRGIYHRAAWQRCVTSVYCAPPLSSTAPFPWR